MLKQNTSTPTSGAQPLSAPVIGTPTSGSSIMQFFPFYNALFSPLHNTLFCPLHNALFCPLNNAIRYSLRQQASLAASIYSPTFPQLFLFSMSKIQVFTSVQFFTPLHVNLRIEPFSYPIGPLLQLPSL